ncbi:MAG TPA: Gfo/Idh/MocA family oxidoreductase [Actinomycetota bacterium]
MTVSVAVIGAGFMGANHARVLSALPGARLAALVDRDADRARALADEFGCAFAASPEELDGDVEAAVVATPTETHRDVALTALARGWHVLVEKPFAPNVPDAEELVAAADDSDRILAVGHIERFNPACLDLPRFVSAPLFIQTRRLSPFAERVREGVVRDMMIHDVDLVLWLAGAEPIRVVADTSTWRAESEDLATATVVFETGLVAHLTATRIGQDKVRQVDILQRDSLVNVDLLRQDITIRRQATAEYPESGARRLREASVMEIPYLEHRGEPLWLELQDFVGAIETGGRPLVDGRAGLSALALCERILDAAERD